VHTDTYMNAVLDGTLGPAEVRRLGLPWSAALRERSLRTAQGTIEAARDAQYLARLDEHLGPVLDAAAADIVDIHCATVAEALAAHG
jgi:hypothetical protein